MSTAHAPGQRQDAPGRARTRQPAEKRPGRPRMAPEVRAAIRRVVTSPEGHELSPVDIRRLLQGQDSYKGRVPSLRSVQREVSKYRPPDPSGWWSLVALDTDADEAALILPVLAEAIGQSHGRWTRFTKKLAGWVVKVRASALDMPPAWALAVADAYSALEAQKKSADGLDQMMAFAPWRGRPHLRRYLQAVKTLHPDWLEGFGVPVYGDEKDNLPMSIDRRVLFMTLGRASYTPDAEGLVIALDCWQRTQEERGTQ